MPPLLKIIRSIQEPLPACLYFWKLYEVFRNHFQHASIVENYTKYSGTTSSMPLFLKIIRSIQEPLPACLCFWKLYEIFRNHFQHASIF